MQDKDRKKTLFNISFLEETEPIRKEKSNLPIEGQILFLKVDPHPH